MGLDRRPSGRCVVTWWMFGLIVGALVVPWLVMGRTILAGFQTGVQQGLGAWTGALWFTIPLTLFGMWLAQLVVH